MKWPPVIGAAHVPWVVRVRDVVLTLAVWAALLVLAHDMAWMAAYWFDVVAGRPPRTPPWPELTLVREVEPYLPVIALLVAWLLFFAIAGYRRLARVAPSQHLTPTLSVAVHRAHCGIDAEAHGRLRDAKTATVELVIRDARTCVVLRDDPPDGARLP